MLSCELNVASLNLLTFFACSCGDIDLIKKYFTRESFNNRPNYSFLKIFIEPGIVHYNGETWRVQKRLTMKALKSLGFGRSVFEPEMHKEINYFVSQIDERRKKGPIRIQQLTGPAASNVVTLIVLGERFDYDHPTRKQLDEMFLRPDSEDKKRANYLGPVNFIASFPYLLKIPSEFSKLAHDFQQTICGYIQNRVNISKVSFNWRTDEPKSYIEHFIKEVEENKDNPEFQKEYFQEKYMVENCYGFLVAGSSTTQEFLEWWFLAMAQHPEVQERMRKEVDEVIGDGMATLADRNSMPYTEAVILEVHRWASIIGLNLPHCVFEESEFGPYLLPAGTQIIVNFDKIHHDSDNFAQPEDFRPERFLSEDGRKFIRSEKVIPFGYGKRSCPGESLAQAETFLFTVTTLQKFVIKATKKFSGQTYTSVFSRLPKDKVEIIAEPRT